MLETNDFYLTQEEPNKSCLLALRDMILANAALNKTVKYGMPCFTYQGKALCYLWTDKKTKEPYILFVDGNLIDHPMLEFGNRARMKILSIDPKVDLPIELIQGLIDQAIDLRK